MLHSPMAGNFFSLAALQGINYLLPLLSFPYLFRVLGVEKWGLISFGYALTQYFIILSDFGFNLSGIKYISQHRDDPEEINTYLNSATVCRWILGFVGLIALLLLCLLFDRFREDYLFYLCYFGMVIGNIMFPLWFFQGIEKMKYITIFNLIAKSLSIIPFFLFVHQPSDYYIVPICYSVGFILAGLASLYFIYVKLGAAMFVPKWRHIKFAFVDSSFFFLSRISTSLFTTSNTFILGVVGGDVAAGYYAGAEKLYQAYNQLLAPFTGVLYPHVAKNQDVPFFKRAFRLIVSANTVVVLLALALSSYLLLLVYGEVLDESLRVLNTLLIACFVTIPSMMLGYPFLAAMGHPSFTNMSLVVTSLAHVLGLTILYFMNAITIGNVAIMVIVSESILLSVRVYGVRKYKLFEV